MNCMEPHRARTEWCGIGAKRLAQVRRVLSQRVCFPCGFAHAQSQVSDDANLLPLRIQADLVVGSIKADITRASNLKNKPEALVK